MVANRKSRERFLASERKRERCIELAQTGMPIYDIIEHPDIGWTKSNYEKHRLRHPDWAARLTSEHQKARFALKRFDGSFASFRLQYLGMTTTWFQQRMIESIEAAKLGEVTMILIPPGHGKTTLLEDWCTYKLATDPTFRIMVASETVDHGKKVLGRVRDRMEPDGPLPQLVNDFGPFAPAHGRSSQPWGATYFDVAGKKQSDERDYSMNCVGITGRVQGTRSDLMLLDDIQDLKSLELSQKYYDIIVQSFLSRPEMAGRTVIIGTRVGEWDVYRLLLDAQIPDHLVTIPAYDVTASPSWPKPTVKPVEEDPETWAPEGTKFLWPEKYGGEKMARLAYAKLRHRIGEKAWARNYMQRPEAAADMTFSEDVTELLKEDFRSVLADVEPVRNEDGSTNLCPVVISLDPAVGGGNGLIAAGMYPDRMDVFNARLDYGLTDYGQIFALLEDWCWLYTSDTSKVEEVVIEDKAFQKGLLRDDRLVELQRKFGFRTVPNTTGREKSDPDIGIPALPFSIRRGEVTIPWADEQSRTAMQPLLDHLHQWRPGVKGNQLPMDMVMALWFAWRRWRGFRNTPQHRRGDSEQFRSSNCSPFRQRQRPRRLAMPYTGAYG